MDPTPSNFYSQNMGGAQRLANGNTLICNAANGVFFEIDSLKNTVWKYINPCSSSGTLPQGTSPNLVQSFRSEFYSDASLAATGKPIVSGDPIELSPYTYSCTTNVGIGTNFTQENIIVSPNPSQGLFRVFSEGSEMIGQIEVFNSIGEKILQSKNGSVDLTEKRSGVYFLKIQFENGSFVTRKIVKD